MTPSARVAAAIDILDQIISGQSAEQALSRWARSSRYAGSKDRAAVRDHVFDTVRHWRSDAVRGGGETGRARMIGRLRAQADSTNALFDGNGYGAAELTAEESVAGLTPDVMGDRWDLPDWMIELFNASLGDDAERTALALTDRAPITLRINGARTTPIEAAARLAADGVVLSTNPRAASALTVSEGARRIRNSEAFSQGLVELQDASSQAAVASLPAQGRVLDFCAGGGGKALALAAAGWEVTAHDIDAARMQDIPVRAARGGHDIAICAPEDLAKVGTFDLVFCDVPCSGSGTWRRAPEAKWTLTSDRLAELVALQAQVLERALKHVRPGGTLAYATCSLFSEENAGQIANFLTNHPEWRQQMMHQWPVDEWGDGFFCAHLTHCE